MVIARAGLAGIGREALQGPATQHLPQRPQLEQLWLATGCAESSGSACATSRITLNKMENAVFKAAACRSLQKRQRPPPAGHRLLAVTGRENRSHITFWLWLRLLRSS